MNKQIVIASLLGSATAALTTAAVTTQTQICSNQIVSDAQAAWAALDKATAGLKTAQTAAAVACVPATDKSLSCAAQTATKALVAAKKDKSDYLALAAVAQVSTDWTKAKKDQADNVAAIAASTGKVAAFGVAIGAPAVAGKLTIASTVAAATYKTQKDKVTRLEKILAEVDFALVQHTEEEKPVHAEWITKRVAAAIKHREYAIDLAIISRVDDLIAGWKTNARATTADWDTGKKGSKQDYLEAKALVTANAAEAVKDDSASGAHAAADATAAKDYFALEYTHIKNRDMRDIMVASCDTTSTDSADWCKTSADAFNAEAGQAAAGNVSGPTYASYLAYKKLVTADIAAGKTKYDAYKLVLSNYGEQKAKIEWAKDLQASTLYFNRLAHADKGLIAKDDTGASATADTVKFAQAASSPASFCTDSTKELLLRAAGVGTAEIVACKKSFDVAKAKTDAAAAEKTAKDAYDKIVKYVKYFNIDKVRSVADIASANAVLAPLNTALIIANSDLAKEVVKQTAEEKVLAGLIANRDQKESAVSALDANYATLFLEVDAQYKRVASRATWYDAAILTRTTTSTAATKAFTDAKGAYDTNVAAVASALTVYDTALLNCKVVRYGQAQTQAKTLEDQEAKDVVTRAAVSAAYAKLVAESQKPFTDTVKDATKASSNTENVLCGFPAKATGKDQAPRPLCKEAYCCGAAQRFMKDGTKMSVETCQKVGTHTYDYYPPLPALATAAPSKQVWRWVCISGAQKLMAVTTAALAASYMMA